MDATSEARTIDALGRRGGSRRYRTIEEKRRIVEDSLVPGASVALIARKYEVNGNLVFAWRRLYQQGLLEVRDAGVALAMMPVKVSEPTKRTIRAARKRRASTPALSVKSAGLIEIELASGQCIRVHGEVDEMALAKIIELLVKR
jgi:transposase